MRTTFRLGDDGFVSGNEASLKLTIDEWREVLDDWAVLDSESNSYCRIALHYELFPTVRGDRAKVSKILKRMEQYGDSNYFHFSRGLMFLGRLNEARSQFQNAVANGSSIFVSQKYIEWIDNARANANLIQPPQFSRHEQLEVMGITRSYSLTQIESFFQHEAPNAITH